MKKKLFLFMVLMLGLIISCGEKKDTAGDGGGEKEVVLRFSWWGGDSRHKATLDAIKLFEEKNPGIKIKAEYSGWDGHFEKVSTQVTGNTAPDIMQIDWNWLYIFSKNGDGFYNFNDLKEDFDLSNYDENVLSYTTINGKVPAIPVGMNGRVFYYNKSLYEKAGLPVPTTADELISSTNILKEKFGNDTYALDISTTDSGVLFFLKYYVEQKFGKSLIDSDNKMGITKEELTEAIQFYKKLVDEGVVLSSKDNAGAGNVPGEQNPLWISGKVGGVYEWNSAISKYQDTLSEGNELIIGDMLTGIGPNKSAFVKVNMALAINKNTKHPKEAAKFLNFLLSDPEAVKILGLSRGIPSNKKAIETLDQEGLLKGIVPEGLEKALAFAAPKSSPFIEDERIRKIGMMYTQKVDYNELTPEQAGEQMYAELEKVIAQISK